MSDPKPEDYLVVQRVEHKKQDNGQYRAWFYHKCVVQEIIPSERLCNHCLNGWVEKTSKFCVSCGEVVIFNECLRNFVEVKSE